MLNEIGFTPLFQIITPATTQAEMDTITNLATQLAREIIASKTDANFKAGFQAFYNEWLIFKANNSGWLARGSSATYAKVLEFKERLRDWQKRFIALGNKSSVELATGAGVGGVFPWKTLAIGGGITVGIYILLKSFMKRGF